MACTKKRSIFLFLSLTHTHTHTHTHTQISSRRRSSPKWVTVVWQYLAALTMGRTRAFLFFLFEINMADICNFDTHNVTREGDGFFPFYFFWVCAFCPSNSLAAQNDKSSIENGKLFMLILHSLRGERTGWNDVLSYEITLLGVVLASFCQQDIIQKKRNLSLLQKSPITYGRKEAKPLLIRALEPFYAVPKANMQCDEHV